MADVRPGRAATRVDDDVWDPINQPLEAHEEAGEMIASTLLPVLRRIADLVDHGTAVTRASSRAVEG